MDHDEMTTETQPTRSFRRMFRHERGAVGTEMAIVVAIVVAIAIALGVVMRDSAEAHQECIPAAPGDSIPAGCDRG